jgi:glycosyltransferase involved in cell wall biosynthesis
MKEPFFSILLPTRNRSEILGGAIESALRQTWPDFELVISDNDESPTATAEVVQRFKDERIRYFRTSGNLAMHENWDNAFDKACGRHVLILEDKCRLLPNALEILGTHLKELGEVVISYDITFAKSHELTALTHLPPAKLLRSETIIEMFCRFEQRFFNILPKGLDSCAPRGLLTEVKKKSPTGFLFSHISPDYSSGFMILAQVDQFYYMEESLVYIPNNWMWKGQFSNGQASYKKTDAYRKFLASLPVTREEILRFVPVKTEFLWINAVLYDFFTKSHRGLQKDCIDWVRYYSFCCILILIGRRLGADMQEQIWELRKALLNEPRETQCRVCIDVVRRLVQLGISVIKNRVKALSSRSVFSF